MTLAVALCLPHRSTCALVTWSGERHADTSKTQREQGRAVLYRWKPRRQDASYLHEEKECV